MAEDTAGKQTHVMINNFLIDASLNERYTFDSDVTEYPVESGANIVDNIRPLPITVEMECLVSNCPIGIVATKRELDKKPVDTAYDLLLKIRSDREPVTIQTSLRTYDNMALKSLNINRGPGGGDALMFTATFNQIQYVTNKREIRVSTPIGQNGRGKKVSKPGTPDGTRLILIDKIHKAWFDPDYGLWRQSVRFTSNKATRVVVTPTGTTTYPPTTTNKWHLYRNDFATVINENAPGGRVNLTNDSSFFASSDPNDTSILGTVAWKQIIAVPLAKCELHDFVIKSKPGEHHYVVRDDSAR